MENINAVGMGALTGSIGQLLNDKNIITGKNEETIFGADKGRINDSSYNIYYKEGLFGPGDITGKIGGQDVDVAVYDGLGKQDITGTVGDKELNLEASDMLGSDKTKYTGVYDGKEVELMVSDDMITGTVDGEQVSINMKDTDSSIVPDYFGKDDSGVMEELLPIINSAEDGPDRSAKSGVILHSAENNLKYGNSAE